MGCCMSTAHTPHKCKTSSHNGGSESQDRAPPPTITEEETVKEVLSETRNPKSTAFFSPALLERKHQHPGVESIRQRGEDDEGVPPKIQSREADSFRSDDEEASEVSEICTFSLNGGVPTSSFRNSWREDDTGRARHHKPRMGGLRSPGNRNRSAGQSPTRRSELSPGKRSVPVVRRVPAQRSVVPRRPEQVDRTGRVSRSPAASGSAVSPGGSPNPSPGRVRSDPTVRDWEQQSIDGVSVESKWAISGLARYNDYATSESLENPSVSLECFIFL